MSVLLVGSGNMSTEYLKVLNSLSVNTVVVGRSKKNVDKLAAKFPEYRFIDGGLNAYLQKNSGTIPEMVIVAVNIAQLQDCAIQLLKAGVKKMLIEKPGALNSEGLEAINKLSKEQGAQVYIAYNRRFYNSISTLVSLAEKEGGIQSVHFEFTEWPHMIDTNFFSRPELERWILSNSTHVIDTVFHLIGKPSTLYTHVSKDKGVEWHPSGAIFAGMGISDRKIPFTYHSNWESAGRWAIEVMTNHNRYYLKPMEKLAVQKKGTIALEEYQLQGEEDVNYKPGLYQMIQAFVSGKKTVLCSLAEHIQHFNNYKTIAGY